MEREVKVYQSIYRTFISLTFNLQFDTKTSDTLCFSSSSNISRWKNHFEIFFTVNCINWQECVTWEPKCVAKTWLML